MPVDSLAGERAQVDLRARAAEARELLRGSCRLCPYHCQVDRLAGVAGRCRVTSGLMVAGAGVHPGEETCLSGWRGSGVIFLSWCNLSCRFCQGYRINARGAGEAMIPAALAVTMLDLQRRGCHNINWVTPTHQMPFLLESLAIARDRGLHVPIVYNCGGFESVDALRCLRGAVDVFVPDFKYWSPDASRHYLGPATYAEVAREAILEMHRQVGDLVVDASGLAVRGLLVRHLVMPGAGSEGREILSWIRDALGPQTAVSILSQYRPMHKAAGDPRIGRFIQPEEYMDLVECARELGLCRVLDSKCPA